MGRIFITCGLIFFVISILGIYLDVLLHIDGNVGYTQIGQMWYKFAPNSLQIAEAIVSRYIDPCSSLEILLYATRHSFDSSENPCYCLSFMCSCVFICSGKHGSATLGKRCPRL